MSKRKDTQAEDVPKSRMTAVRWKRFLELTIAGCKRAEAEKDVGLTSYCVQQHLITDNKAKEEYEEAQQSWRRSEQDPEVIEGVLESIMQGKTMAKACAPYVVEPATVYSWILNDTIWREKYETAREVGAEFWLDQTMDIANDGSNDTYLDDNGNARTAYDVVQRSKLRVDNLWRAMSKMNYKRYGDKQQVDQHVTQHVDQVEALDKARRRKEKAAQKRKDKREGVQAQAETQEERPPVH